MLQQLDLQAIDVGGALLRGADENAAVAVLRQLELQGQLKITILPGGSQPLRALATGGREHAILDSPVPSLALHALPTLEIFAIEEGLALLPCPGQIRGGQENEQAGGENGFHWLSPLHHEVFDNDLRSG